MAESQQAQAKAFSGLVGSVPPRTRVALDPGGSPAPGPFEGDRLRERAAGLVPAAIVRARTGDPG